MITNPKGSVFKSISNQQPADELQKPIIKKFKEGRIYSSFKDNILGVNLADMQLIGKYNKGITFLICMIDILSKSAWAVSLKKKQRITIVNAFQSIWGSSKIKRKNIWVYEGSEFYKKSFKKWLKDNYIKMYSTYIDKRFIRTLKLKHKIVASKNVKS